MRPAYSVELPGFRSVVSKLNPRYCLPDRNYFSRTGILTLYNEVREEVERELEGEVVVNFSGTTDLWTSGSSDPYITFTMHYIDSTWQLRSYCLGAMVTTLQICFLHLCLTQKICTEDTIELFNMFLATSQAWHFNTCCMRSHSLT